MLVELGGRRKALSRVLRERMPLKPLTCFTRVRDVFELKKVSGGPQRVPHTARGLALIQVHISGPILFSVLIVFAALLAVGHQTCATWTHRDYTGTLKF